MVPENPSYAAEHEEAYANGLRIQPAQTLVTETSGKSLHKTGLKKCKLKRQSNSRRLER